MSARVRIDIHHERAQRTINKYAAASTRRAAGFAQRRAKANLTAAGRINSGALRGSIDVRQIGPTRFSIGSDLHYAIYQEKGIGPVVPVRAKVLRFKPKGSNTFVFAQRTRGFDGAHYLEKALRSLTMREFWPR